MPMEIIIAVVVLVVIALAVIMITTGGLTKGSKTTSTAQNASGEGLECQAQAMEYCSTYPSAAACDPADCPKCGEPMSCGRVDSP